MTDVSEIVGLIINSGFSSELEIDFKASEILQIFSVMFFENGVSTKYLGKQTCRA